MLPDRAYTAVFQREHYEREREVGQVKITETEKLVNSVAIMKGT